MGVGCSYSFDLDLRHVPDFKKVKALKGIMIFVLVERLTTWMMKRDEGEKLFLVGRGAASPHSALITKAATFVIFFNKYKIICLWKLLFEKWILKEIRLL